MSNGGNSYEICQDVIFSAAHGGVVASNHRAKRHVWINLPLLSLLAKGPAQGPFLASNLTRFGNLDGLLADPTGLRRNAPQDIVEFSDASAAISFLEQSQIVVRDQTKYFEYFSEKTSILDRRRFGTFHQQLGVELLVRRKIDPQKWWYEQKFDPETGLTRENLYKFVQNSFLDKYFQGLDIKGRKVLDFGCGGGMASKRFAAMGASVIGVDPDVDLLAKAQASVGESFTAIHLDLASPEPLAVLPDDQLDFIWMADVFMFYFHPMAGGKSRIRPSELLVRLSRNLVPSGRCVIMQPHGVFWLAPWLGNREKPFTILTEYAERLYSVTPSLQAMADSIAEAKLVISRIHEPRAENGPGEDVRGYHFAREFPLWWVFECEKRL